MLSMFGLIFAATLFFAGDSTLDDHGFKPPYRSWGREAGALMTPGNVISNFAKSGASTKSFRADGHWAKLIAAVKPGDFVLIEFGHNDQKRSNDFYREKRWADPNGLFREIVRDWVSDVRTKGATPILASPICRGFFDAKGRVVDGGLGAYRTAMKELSEELHCDFVDMNALTRQQMEKVGRAETEKYFVYSTGLVKSKDGEPAKDLSHPIKKGAETFAQLFVADVRARGLPVARLFAKAAEAK